MHLNSEMIFVRHVAPLIQPGHRVLEISAEAIPSAYQRASQRHKTWHHLSLGVCDGADYVATEEYAYPVCSGTYDVVISGQVIEHVRMPWLWMCELARICKPGGLVVTIGPVSWPYHPAPVDCWRIYPEGMRALYEYAHLTVEISEVASLDKEVADTVTLGRVPETDTR